MALDQKFLENKTNPLSNDLLSISFEYLLAGISNEHSMLLGVSDTKRFNESNRLSWPVLISYPFFVSLANGNSESLFNLFSPFYSTNLGPISLGLYNIMKDATNKRKFKYFQNPISDKGTITRVLEETKTFSDIQRDIKEEIVMISKQESLLFKEVKIQSDNKIETNLFSAIDSGIKVITQQSGNSFFDGDIRTILHQASYFEILKKEIPSDELPTLISYSDVVDPTLRPFYLEELF